MTPKETAFELYFEFYRNIIANSEKSKQCALIAVDEILSINNERWYQLSGFKETFYKEVKQEIEKL